MGWLRSLFGDKLPPDEPDKPGSVVVDHLKLWPKSPVDEYRIINYPHRGSNRYGLQAGMGECWKTVLAYHDGRDAYGKLRAGRWMPPDKICSWEVRDLMALIDKMKGRGEAFIVVDTNEVSIASELERLRLRRR